MTFDLKAHLRALTEVHAPSGHEDPARAIIADAWAPVTDEQQRDGLGSLIGVKRATHPLDPQRKIMLAAHMDEIGMLVRDVMDGFILIQRISGVDNRIMPSQTVVVHGREALPGIVAAKPPHLSGAEERKKYPGWDDLMIDVGLPPDEVADLVRPGDVITADGPLMELAGRKVAGKAMDDRACVAVVTQCLHALQGVQHQWDVYAAATVQEEFGNYNGARTAAHLIDPDVAIALDVTFAAQPGVNGDGTVDLSGGPALAFGPNFHIKLFDAIKRAAADLELPLQDDIITGRSGTDAWGIQVSRMGVPTALISVPVRNMHSPVETIDLREIERAGRLLAHFITRLDADFLASIDWKQSDPDEAAAE